ncbi:chitin deacetylase 8-like [Leptidea sinapis]|uniref:chitin deacetylase 8-like n=1 Tax=Leptidea sinapis TaxID=189913 RepID=UPI002135FBFE|nr:chitin deacetylase 8-like [Leptidea sinapis]
MRIAFVFALLLSISLASELPLAEECDPDICTLPQCLCSSTAIPGNLAASRIPQFVLLTFNGAVTSTNTLTYRRLLSGRRNSNQCPIGTTFFVSHEYTDYQLLNELYNNGFEIALHSITNTNQSYFANADYETLMLEFDDQKKLISHFASIPVDQLKGIRMPFLQLAGNTSFEMMKDASILYDNSWPTINFKSPPLWPYTLDFASIQDCVTPPCPTASLPGSWVVPMVAWTDLQGNPCAMADSCFYPPDSYDENGWFRFLVKNFENHYLSNRAPFPIHLQEGYFRERPGFEAAFIRFLNMINSMSDVFMVNTLEAIEWIQNPVSAGEYIAQSCRHVVEERCRPSFCPSLIAPHKEENFYMSICNTCPATYPWLGNPFGL